VGAELAVVAATHRRPAALARLLGALERQTLSRALFTVTVVNDGSHDAAYEAALAAHPGTRYLARPRRGGPAAARNAGAAGADAEWLLFTDDDCVPPPDWLEGFRSRASGGDADLVGGPVLPPPGERPGRLGRFLAESRFIRPLRGPGGELLGLPSANLAVRRGRFERAGGFDERFPYPGGEDLDLCGRLLAAGARAAYDERWVTHHGTDCGWAGFLGRYYRYGYGEALLREFGRAPQAAPLPWRRKLRLLLGLAGKAAHPWAERPWEQRALTAARELSYEAGRLCAALRPR
jgi:GT2 family glycosyltransferase